MPLAALEQLKYTYTDLCRFMIGTQIINGRNYLLCMFQNMMNTKRTFQERGVMVTAFVLS